MKLSINFYCRPSCISKKTGMAPVECVITSDGNRATFQLPRKMFPDEFKKEMSGKQMTDTKMFCRAVENKLYKIQTELSINDEPITPAILKDIYINGQKKKSYTIGEMFNDGLKLKISDNIEPASFKKYELSIDKFYRYTNFKEYDEAGAVTNSDIVKLKNDISKDFASTYTCKTLKNIKFFFEVAFEDGKIKKNPFSKMRIGNGKVQEEVRWLTYEEIDKIRKLRITNDSIDKARNVFLFQCFTGLAFVDICNLVPADVQTSEDGTYYISKKRVKSDVTYTTVLFEDAKDIWELYKGELPVVSKTNYNIALKRIAEMAGLELNLTSHIARHSFASLLLNTYKLDIVVVSKAMGHSSIKMTEQYLEIFNSTVLNSVKQLDKKPTPDDITKPQKYDTPAKRFKKIVLGI